MIPKGPLVVYELSVVSHGLPQQRKFEFFVRSPERNGSSWFHSFNHILCNRTEAVCGRLFEKYIKRNKSMMGRKIRTTHFIKYSIWSEEHEQLFVLWWFWSCWSLCWEQLLIEAVVVFEQLSPVVFIHASPVWMGSDSPPADHLPARCQPALFCRLRARWNPAAWSDWRAAESLSTHFFYSVWKSCRKDRRAFIISQCSIKG